MKKILTFLGERLSEKTTWISILTVVGSLLGCKIAPEMSEAIIAIGLGITSLVLVLVKEK